MEVESGLYVLVVALLVVSILIAALRDHGYRQIPVAPGRLPFIGHAHVIDMQRPHIVLTELSKSLGPMFRLNMYGEEIVVLNDYDTISEALVTNGCDVAGRPPMYRTSMADRSSQSIVWQTYTPKLIFLRKEVQKSLKMYGSGLHRLEENCAPEIRQMVETIAKTRGHQFDPWGCVFTAVSTVMLNLILGTQVSPKPKCLEKLREINVTFNTIFGSGSARRLDFLPWPRFLKSQDHMTLQRALRLRDSFWEEDLLPMESGSGGVVERLMGLLQGEERERYCLSENTAKEVFTNLILAGTDTTSTALTCLLLFLLHYPDVQNKLYAEVQEAVGCQRVPCLADKQNMPYTEATLMELLRILAHVPLAVPHYTMRDTNIQHKHIPAGTTVYINLWALMHDDKVWEEPWTFKPERFLDDSGHLLPPSHPVRRRMLAFGAGRRVCLGEILAKNRLFLFSTAIVQSFQFEPVPGEDLPDADPRTFIMGLVLHPKPFQLCAKPRHQHYLLDQLDI